MKGERNARLAQGFNATVESALAWVYGARIRRFMETRKGLVLLWCANLNDIGRDRFGHEIWKWTREDRREFWRAKSNRRLTAFRTRFVRSQAG